MIFWMHMKIVTFNIIIINTFQIYNPQPQKQTMDKLYGSMGLRTQKQQTAADINGLSIFCWSLEILFVTH